MKTLDDHLSQYAAYHRDRRNVATHFVGIPLIVLAVATLLARPELHVAGVALSPMVAVVALTLAFYLRLDVRFAAVMALFLGGAGVLAAWLARGSTASWLVAGIGLFVVGWVIQFVGHIFEGRKPAFVDDLVGLLVGPLFIVAEAGFALGLRREVEAEITRRAGPMRSGRTAATA